MKKHSQAMLIVSLLSILHRNAYHLITTIRHLLVKSLSKGICQWKKTRYLSQLLPFRNKKSASYSSKMLKNGAATSLYKVKV
ncbi:hypothetical protein [Streptococcus pseudoporcinus]|uniref:Uncharacterized protein n=1 Tax=Streptococcus pseudoporcinus LQ 940-04 TaxID=875093 RepID=G5K9K1_9STRE|nr:hypothetical protein [Streptococcus pseudoporcinus]EFR43633.1 hypothetical protein HMPREF9320_1252 [Streptococcus pseudoporcinus SPIN 20026]EHI64279.1 hypothetical protein STRPS_0745 [Streptococcus pseudoporcinus LQ 940-04]